jgi:hypothetical protein
MKIYFGAVDINEVFDPTGMFACPGNHDELFYYGIEFGSNPGGTDELCIFDGCDRSIPVDMASVEPMIKALERILVNYHALEVAKDIKANVEDPNYTQSV